jgi:small subunit ribosomal protein S13
MYIFESELSEKKRVNIALNSVFGLKKSSVRKIIKRIGFSNNFKLKNISNDQTAGLVKTINSLPIKISNDLKKHNFSILKALIDLKSIKSFRLNKGLPVRGQRTHTNAKTAKKKLYFSNIKLLVE